MSYYENMPIRFLKDKATGEIFVNSDDIVKALGQSDSFIDFLGTDEGLEYINEWKKNHPGEPFFGGAVKKEDNLNIDIMAHKSKNWRKFKRAGTVLH